MGDVQGTARPFPLWRLLAAHGHRPSINVRISPPEHLARLTMLNLAPSSVFRSCSRNCDEL
jgi:hypothetical protein